MLDGAYWNGRESESPFTGRKSQLGWRSHDPSNRRGPRRPAPVYAARRSQRPASARERRHVRRRRRHPRLLWGEDSWLVKQLRQHPLGEIQPLLDVEQLPAEVVDLTAEGRIAVRGEPRRKRTARPNSLRLKRE